MLKPGPSIYLKSGEYSRYGFALGYVERHHTRHRLASLWLERGVYQVREDNTDDRTIVLWETFSTLGAARKVWRRIVRDNPIR